MIRAAILCRVSTTAQADNTSLADQRRILTDLCQRQGWDCDVFEEVESGGAGIANRPILAQLLGRIAAGEYQRLVVLVPDRLSRAGVGELEQIGATLARVGARLVTQSGEFDPSNLDHGLALDLQAVLAKNERLRIRERTIRGREAVIRGGGFAGHPTPYGWRRVWEPDGSFRFDVVPEEADVVRQVVDLYLTGRYSIEALADRFDLTYARVSNILRSPRYAGIERFRGERKSRHVSGRDPIVVPSKVWPAIVTVDQWEAAAAMLARKVTHEAGGGPAKHPLSGIARCRGCDGPLYYVLNHGTIPLYHCQEKGCRARQYLNADDAHRSVLRRLPAIVEQWAAAQTPVDADPADDLRRALAAKRSALKKREDNLFDLLADGGITPQQFRDQNQRVIDERAAIDQQAAALDRHSKRTGPPVISIAEAAQIAAAADDLLDDPAFLRTLFAGLFQSVRIGQASVKAKTGTRSRPVLSLQAATLRDGTNWTRNRHKTPR